MLVPDFMHEFELGVFKQFFMHFLRILYTYGNDTITELNYRCPEFFYSIGAVLTIIRFRLIPTFGQSTVRRFTRNTSALKQMAAWNYQAILVVC